MALPLLAIGAGLLGLKPYYDVWKQGIQDEYDQENWQKNIGGATEGLDRNDPEYAQKLGERLLQNKQTAQLGANIFDTGLRQSYARFEHENPSAYQNEMLNLDRQRMAQDEAQSMRSYNLSLAQKQAENNLQAALGGFTVPQIQTGVDSLGKEFAENVSDESKKITAGEQVKNLLINDPTGTGAHAAVLSYFKTLDPTSVVSSTELEMGKKAGLSPADVMTQKLTRAFSSGLQEPIRQEFLDTITNVQQSAFNSAMMKRKNFEGIVSSSPYANQLINTPDALQKQVFGRAGIDWDNAPKGHNLNQAAIEKNLSVLEELNKAKSGKSSRFEVIK
jgi:hypothetical protein